MKLTGKPSIDKPWLQFYPEQLRNVEVPKMTIEEFLKYKNQDENRTAFEYLRISAIRFPVCQFHLSQAITLKTQD